MSAWSCVSSYLFVKKEKKIPEWFAAFDSDQRIKKSDIKPYFFIRVNVLAHASKSTNPFGHLDVIPLKLQNTAIPERKLIDSSQYKNNSSPLWNGWHLKNGTCHFN